MFGKFCTRIFSEIFSENFVIKLPGWNRQKILKVGVSLGGTWNVPRQPKEKRDKRPSVLDSFKNLAFYCLYFCIRHRYRSLF